VIDALIAGRLWGAPVERETSAGKRYATAKLRVSTRDGEALFVNVIAFAEVAVAALLVLQDGDSAALSGELTPKVYTVRDGTARPALDLLAHALLTEYHVARKRQAVQQRASADAGDEAA
jgi:single-stranded DNA-binding protein